VSERFERPELPPGFDASRAVERRDEAAAWGFGDVQRAGVWRAIVERRDIRHFRPDPLPDELVHRLLEAAHRAPSVGLMQPWRFIVVRSEETKTAMQALVARERLVQAEHFGARASQYLDLKIEGVREAPVSVCVCCDRGSDDDEVLGRHTIHDTDVYSTCLAIENLWLAARAEGVGVGWVSFYRPEDLSRLLCLPPRVIPIAWLCVGYPDERPSRPSLEAAGWARRRSVDEMIFDERWSEHPRASPTPTTLRSAQEAQPVEPPSWLLGLAGGVRPGDSSAMVRVRDAADELVKPKGSLGVLETMVERWAMAVGSPPPSDPRAAILVFAADHGVSTRDVSLYPGRVGRQVAAAAVRGHTAIGVLARALSAELVVADVGLIGPRIEGLVDVRVGDGSGDITLGPALTARQLRQAIEVGYDLGQVLSQRSDLILVGEVGIGNTTVASALLSALTGLSAETVCGRGTGIDSQGLARKRTTVAAALAANGVDAADPLDCLRCLGGLEFAALVGAMLAAAASRRPVLLDGFATGVAALVACRVQPSVRDYLMAGHRSAEPAHGYVLTELGLEPLLDLRLRLGEASGAALALPLVGLAGRLHTEMRRFDEAGVDRPSDILPRTL
jgi:nicotinate-nucleotide--dimethylbenzimidazole phosphoribosyltransferase